MNNNFDKKDFILNCDFLLPKSRQRVDREVLSKLLTPSLDDLND